MGATIGKDDGDDSSHNLSDQQRGFTNSLRQQELTSTSIIAELDSFGFTTTRDPVSAMSTSNDGEIKAVAWRHTQDKDHRSEGEKPFGLDETAISDTTSSQDSSLPSPQNRPASRRRRILFFYVLGISLLAGAIVAAIAYVVGKKMDGRLNDSNLVLGGQGEEQGDTTTGPLLREPSVAPTLRPSGLFVAGFSTLTPSSAPAPFPPPAPSPELPTAAPSSQLSNSTPALPSPTTSPETPSPTWRPATYVPGNLTRSEAGLLLSEGLRARMIATSGEPVEYYDGTVSDIVFHGRPDFGATFPDTRPFNEGGWVYASNSEMEDEGTGGVGSLTFNKDGNIIDYRMVLENSTMNCGGGKTPWGTWVSCEEVEFFGKIWQVDPFGERVAETTTIGSQLGRWESFAFDVRDPEDPKFFATEDHNKGTVRRFRPDRNQIDWDTPWDMLHVNGTIDYLRVFPNEDMTGGTFEWTDDFEGAKNNARSFYPQSEGIDIYEGQMYVVCKNIKQLFVFNLDDMTYYNQTTVSGLFDGGPDQMKRILDNEDSDSDLLYFTEEGGVDAGIHARDAQGRFYTIFESPVYPDETTGLSFSPDANHMYVAYQDKGFLFDIWREDGLAFGARTLNVKYHHQNSVE